MKKSWAFILCLLLFSSVSAENHYVTQGGGGDGSSSGSPWSVADFNNPNNWNNAVNSNDGFIGPGDTVYFGDITDTALFPQMSGTLNNPIVFDGYEAGICDAHGTTCSGSAVMSGTSFLGDNSYLTFRDFVFTNQNSITGYWDENPSRSFISSCYNQKIDNCKTSHITIANNHFRGKHAYGGAISLGFVNDWLVENNYYQGDGECTIGDTWHYGTRESFIGLRTGGSRGRFINNHVIDSFVAFYAVLSIDRNTDGVWDFPSSGSYSKDPEAHITGLEVAYNVFDDWCEEGISFDDPSGSEPPERQYPTVEIDTISSIDTVNNYIYLDNSGGEWTPVTEDRYSGFYLVNTVSVQERYGKIALIEDQYQNRFTLSPNDISKFSVGDRVTVTLVQNKIWIHHNHMIKHSEGWMSILAEGNFFNGLIENNHLEEQESSGCSDIMLQSTHGSFINPNSVTQDNTHVPVAFNLVRYNRAERFQASSYPLFSYSGWDFSYNNAWNDNILWETGDDCNNFVFSKVYSYYNNNIYDPSGNPIDVVPNANGGGLMTPDPTTGVPGAIYSQSHIGPNILSTHVTGTSLKIVFTEPIVGCSSGGNCGFSIKDSSGSVTLNQNSGSGAIRTFTIGRTHGTNANLFYDGTGNIRDSDGVNMYMWSITGHDLNTEYTEDSEPTYECNDNIDNDGDGQTDLSDSGCSSATDDDETDCGDGICEGGELCNVCVPDCGVCPQVNFTGCDGLKLLYSFDGDATDFTGNHNGVVHGATQASGKFGGAYSLDGNDDYRGYGDNHSYWITDSKWGIGADLSVEADSGQ